MLLIHQIKSGGSSLKTGLVRDLSIAEYTDSGYQPTITARNSRPDKVISDLRPFASDTTVIRSVHLHPTPTILNHFKTEGIKSVILLRNPHDSFEAAKRHRTADNQKKRVHQIYRRFGEDALVQLIEFNHNWRTLAELNQFLFISFDEVVDNYPEVVKKIALFYDIPVPQIVAPLPKVRYSGVGGNRVTDLSATNGPTQTFSPYSKRKAVARSVFEQAPFFFKASRSFRFFRKRMTK